MLAPRQILDHDDTGKPWPAGRGDSWDFASAYETALAVRALRVARGEFPRGYKIGFTNRSIWPRYNVYAPIWGTVWNTTVTECDGTGTVSLSGICQPRIEPEAVFGFTAAPPDDADLDGIFSALDWVAPGFEIVQSHMPDWKFDAPQTVADGGLHARLLIGPRVPIAELASDAAGLDSALAAARVELSRNGALVEEGAGANVLDGPLRALRHFIAELRSCPGAAGVKARDVVTTGTWTDAWPVAPGERWAARYDSVLSALEVEFR